jgi:hypothetical protein
MLGRITVPSVLPAASDSLIAVLRNESRLWIVASFNELALSCVSTRKSLFITVIQSFAIGSTKETPVLSVLVWPSFALFIVRHNVFSGKKCVVHGFEETLH